FLTFLFYCQAGKITLVLTPIPDIFPYLHGRGNWDAMLRDPKWILEEQKIIDEPMMEQPKLQFPHRHVSVDDLMFSWALRSLGCLYGWTKEKAE
ncbi:hypothetical protein ACJX0J_014104, partial [Zea mays]